MKTKASVKAAGWNVSGLDNEAKYSSAEVRGITNLRCGTLTYSGFADGHGTMYKSLIGSGIAHISFRNAWSGGKVKLLLNGSLIAASDPYTIKNK